MTTITINNGEIIVTGTKYKVQKIEGTNKEKIKELKKMLASPPDIEGSFWPDPYSMLGAHTCLFHMYYKPGGSMKGIMEVEGEIEKVPKVPDGAVP